ncbi:MAG: hypothetical protein WBK55_10080 [Alphaproteobacteria bacterium]
MPHANDPRLRQAIERVRDYLFNNFEYQASKFMSPAALIMNPWNRFFRLTKHDEGFAFRIYDREQSIFSRERSGKRFFVRAIPETVESNADAVRYEIKQEKRIEFKQFNGTKVKVWQARPTHSSATKDEAMEFFLYRLSEHSIEANKARDDFLTRVAAGGALALTFSLWNKDTNDHKPRTPLKQEIIEQRQNPPAPVTPIPAPRPSGQETIEREPEPRTQRAPLGPSPQSP